MSQPDTGNVYAVQHLVGNATELIVDDDDVLFGGGLTPTSGDVVSGSQPLFLAHRSAGGWMDSQFSPPPGPFDNDGVLEGVTPSLSGAVFQAFNTVLVNSGPGQNADGHLVFRDGAGRFTSLGVGQFAGMSDDGQTVAFSATAAPAGLPSSDGLDEVYVWHPDGSVRRIPDAAGEPADCGHNRVFQQPRTLSGAVSSDGQTVFMAGEQPVGATDCPPSQLYVNRGGSTTLVSGPQPGAPALDPTTESTAVFAGASRDGSIAYFTTANQLTSASTSGQTQLYQWRAAHGATPATVSCVSCAVAPNGVQAPTPQPNEVSTDGAYAYFSTTPDPSTNESGFYVFHDGSVQLVRAQAAFEAVNTPVLDAAGDVVVWQQSGNSGFSFEIDRAVIGGGAPQVSCLTCDASGQLGSPDLLNYAGTAGDNTVPLQQVTADGSRVVMESARPLTADAAAGIENVYLWSAGQGLSLVAPRAQYAEISPDGSNIVFQSTAALTADTTQVGVGTLYDARVGGGFPAAAAPAPCDPAGCRGAAPTPSGTPVDGGATRSSGQLSQAVRLGSLHAPGRGALARFARGQRLRLRVSVSAATAVRAVLRRRGAGSPRVLASARARPRATSGQVTLTLRLARSARTAVAGRRPVAVTLTITAAGGVTRTLTFTLPGRPA